MKSSLITQGDCEDIYNRRSVAIQDGSNTSQMYRPPAENEEIRVVAFGPIREYFDRAVLPEELPKTSRKVARIGLGSTHVVFLFVGTEVAVCGKNDKGQIGLPIKPRDEDNIYNDLRLIEFESFGREDKRVIDIAAGTNHTMFLVEPRRPDPEVKGEQRQIYICGDRNTLGKFSQEDSHEPVLVKLPRFEEDPDIKIKFIYSSNEKCIIMDTDHGLTLWGRNFDGFIQRTPILFCRFKHTIKRIAVGIKHGLAVDENQKLYVWGDGTYGELGEDQDNENRSSEIPVKVAYFDNKDIKVNSVSAGYRHSIVVDTEGKMYSFGDNSKGQLASYDERSSKPNEIDADFQVMAVFSGLNHNLVKTKEGRIYTWGGQNKFKSGKTNKLNFLDFMYEFKGKKTSNIQTAQDNTVVISHLKL